MAGVCNLSGDVRQIRLSVQHQRQRISHDGGAGIGLDRLGRQMSSKGTRARNSVEQAQYMARDGVKTHVPDIHAKVIAEARRQGLSPKIAEPVWRELIARSIALEFEAFDQRAQSREV